MNKTVKIKEIFASIQGEGPYVGYKQLFIRFCNCNLKCNYCDTDFSSENDYKEYCAQELADEVNKYSDVHSISLTGGEPLLSADFLKEFLPLVYNTTSRKGIGEKPKIYLETNATLAEKFLEVKPFIDIVSADIKLESATGIKDTFKFHDKFFEACRGVETFAKIVFNEKITDEEIDKCCELGKKYGIELILQPEMVVCEEKTHSQSILPRTARKLTYDAGKFSTSQSQNRCNMNEITTSPVTLAPRNDNTSLNMFNFQLSTFNFQLEEILDKFLSKYPHVRLIPQVHKFLDVR